MVLVGLSRVRDLAHIHTIPIQQSQNQNQLLKLKEDPEMLGCLHGYNTPNNVLSKFWKGDCLFESFQQSCPDITDSIPKMSEKLIRHLEYIQDAQIRARHFNEHIVRGQKSKVQKT